MKTSLFHCILYCFFQILLLVAQCHSIYFYNKSPVEVYVRVVKNKGSIFGSGEYYKVLPGESEYWNRVSWSKMSIWIRSGNIDIDIDLYEDGYVNFYSKDNITAMQQYGRDTIPVRIPIPKSELQRLQRKAERTRHRLDDSKLHLVITGNSGTGKSTFINLICNINDWDLGAASVGEVETTMNLQQYIHPEYSHIHIWDTPGTGTKRNPSSEYFGNKSIYIFDAILILSSDRIAEGETNIIKEAMDWNITTFFVRNYAKKSYDSRKRRQIEETEQEFIRQTILNITSQVNANEVLRTNIYVIDTHHPESFEYENLRQRLLNETKPSNKQEI